MKRTTFLGAALMLAVGCADYGAGWTGGPPAAYDRDGLPGDRYEAVGTNPFVVVSHDPFSTFAADVDTASYDIFMRDLSHGVLPDQASVRLEEYVNAFDYAYPAPDAGAEVPFAIDLRAAPHPTSPSLMHLRVAIQASNPPEFLQLPTSLVYLVDVSGSMGTADKLPLVQEVMRHSLDTLGGNDTVSIVTYAGSTRVALAPTRVSGRRAIEDAIEALASGGGTGGAAGIRLAYEQARAGFIEGGFNHVVLCTDGDFNIGPSSNDELVEIIEQERRTGVTLTALGFGSGNLNDAMMERVTNAGNGVYTVIRSARHAERYASEDLLHTAHFIAQDMKLQVEFNPDHVQAYRLLGYENREIADDDFRVDEVDAGEVGAGHRVTALYELVMTGGTIPQVAGAPSLDEGAPVEGEREIGADELVQVRVRWKDLGATETDPAYETAAGLAPGASRVADADFEWATAIAMLAEIVKGNAYGDVTNLDYIEGVIAAQATRDEDRAELAASFDAARDLILAR